MFISQQYDFDWNDAEAFLAYVPPRRIFGACWEGDFASAWDAL